MMGLSVVCLMLTGCGDANVSLVKDGHLYKHPKETIAALMNRNFNGGDWDSFKEKGKVKVTYSGTVSANAHTVDVNEEQLKPYKDKMKAQAKAWEDSQVVKEYDNLKSKSYKLGLEKENKKDRRNSIIRYFKNLKKIEEDYTKKKDKLTKDIEWKIKNRPKHNVSKSDYDHVFKTMKEHRYSDIQRLKYSFPEVEKKKKSQWLAESSELLTGIQKIDSEIPLVNKEKETAYKKMLEAEVKYEKQLESIQKELDKAWRKINLAIQKKILWPVGCKVVITWTINSSKNAFKVSNISGLTSTYARSYEENACFAALLGTLVVE